MTRPIGSGGPTSPSIPQSTETIQETKSAQSSSSAAKSSESQAKATNLPTASSSRSNNQIAESKLDGVAQQSLLRSQLESKSLLKRGMEGEQVGKLQDFLISKGYMTAQQKSTGPEKFGPQTEAALKAFQRESGLKDDGVLGPKTRKAMEGHVKTTSEHHQERVKKTSTEQVKNDPPKAHLDGTKEVPDSQLKTTRSLEEQAKLYDKYKDLIPEGKLKQGKNEMNIVGLRHHDISKNESLRAYDDRFLVMWKDDAGNKRVSVFEGATHTGQKYVKGDQREDGSYKAKFTDVNQDGKSDIAFVKPGTYDFHMGKSSKYGEHLRPDDNIAAWRDTNQDGKITGNEKNTNYEATAILFHKGGTKMPLSVGCQTMHPDEFDNFMDLVKKDPNGKISYTLAEAD
jgi:peptidoglycan hydrolase-like protein with peptidoglycan-binding domain